MEKDKREFEDSFKWQHSVKALCYDIKLVLNIGILICDNFSLNLLLKQMIIF